VTNKVLYIGETERLKIRISQHRRKVHPGTFAARYNLYKLVYFENFDSKERALTRERQMKKWKRDWKLKIINDMNPNWDDLYDSIK
jgi:putative endonuclease